MVDQINNFGEAWLGLLWKASIQGGAAVAVVWCICRYVPRITPAFKVWLWRLAWLKLLVALFWPGSINLPLLAPFSISPVASEPISSPVVSREMSMQTVLPIKPSLTSAGVLFIVWLFGTGFCMGHLAFEWNRCRQLKRRASPLAIPAFANLCARMRLKRPPELRQSLHINMPVLIGIVRPAIIIPSRLAGHRDLGMMLAHELAHLKRRDLLWAWLPATCQALFFFHPLVWLTRREWLLAQEMACDELALQHSSGPPAAYGNMLIELVAAPVPRPGFGALGISENIQNLKRRIMAMKTLGKPGSRWMMFGLIVASVAGILPWRIVAQDKAGDPTQRIQQLEQENARLRQELETLRTGSNPEQLAAEIEAARADLDALRTKYTDQHPRVREATKRLEKLREYQAALKEAPRQGTNEARRAAEAAHLAESAAQKQRQRERELYEEELALARKYADTVRQHKESGRASLEELVRAQRQVFGIQREIARLDENRAHLREVLEEELAAVQRLLREVQKLGERGLVPIGHDLDLQREMLKLKRELLKLEQP